jgi:hypothetical protein
MIQQVSRKGKSKVLSAMVDPGLRKDNNSDILPRLCQFGVSVSCWGQKGLTAARGALKRPADIQNLLKTGCSSAFLTHFLVSAGDFNHPLSADRRSRKFRV